MNVIELYNLTKWVNKVVVVETGLIKHYQKLYAHFKQAPNNFKVSLENEKNTLIETLNGIDFLGLTKDQIQFLDDLNISFALGLHGIKPIEDILFVNQITVQTVDQEFKRIINTLDKAISRITSISNGLNGYVDDELAEHQDNVLIRVGFLDNASMSNVEDFKNWGEKWYFIGRGISMAHGVTPQDIKIVGATRGSIILELLTDPEIAETVGRIILWSQKFIKNYLVIKKLMASAENSKLKNDPITETLAKQLAESETHSEDDINKIAEEIVKELGLKENVSGDTMIELKKAITILFDFNKKGGAVNLITYKQEEDSDKKDVIARVRKMDTDIRALDSESKDIVYQINNNGQKKLK